MDLRVSRMHAMRLLYQYCNELDAYRQLCVLYAFEEIERTPNFDPFRYWTSTYCNQQTNGLN